MPLVKQLQEVWDALRADNSRRDHALQSIRIRNLRGIQDLRVPFTYPVSVLAGPNGCGKSTVLFACACAYRDPKRKPKDLTPSSLFPNFDNRRQQELSDSIERTELAFDYIHEGANYPMDWNRGKSWNRSFRGRKGGKQPERTVYLRTLANLTNPSEVRGLLQLARKEFETETLTPDLLIFAHRILRRRYRNLSVIASGDRDLLFAETEDEQAAERYGHHARLVFLPGDASPEHWVWNRLREHPQEYAAALGSTQPGLERNMQEIEQLVEGGVQQTSFIKSALNALGDNLNRPPQDIARLAGRTEAEKKRGDMARFLVEFEERIAAWRQP